MALTSFGKAVRKARIDAGTTLIAMAESLNVAPSFISGMETGRKKISSEWVEKINSFFINSKYGKPIQDLAELALIANNSVPVDGLPIQHQMLIAGFAKSHLTTEELEKVAKCLKEIYSEKKDDE